MRPPIAILDVDGTLVDTNYHHTLAWYRAFLSQDLPLPMWRIHRHIGMGGDQIVRALCGDDVEQKRGDRIRDVEKERYFELIGEVRPFRAARRLIDALKDRGHAVIVASSAKREEVDHYLELLEARDVVDGWTTSADVERTKPHPDLVCAAIEKAGGGAAVLVGDSTWDCEAARRVGIETVALLTGGFSEQELREAGAVCTFESIEDLLEGLERTPLGQGSRQAVS